MPSLVVPFRGAKGKSRLATVSGDAREALTRAMLDDVVAACTQVGPTFVVGPAGTETGEATLVRDPGGGQGAAVRAGLEAAALASRSPASETEGTDPEQAEREGTETAAPGARPAETASPRPGSPRMMTQSAAGPLLVVNADLACVTARDLLALAGAVSDGGLAYAPAADGTTNALALASPGLFVPVYGPGSAARFAALGPSRRVDAPNLSDDVDTVADLERLGSRLGPRTRSVLASLHIGAAA